MKTIETHRQSLGRKLGASNRVELARLAIQVGLAPLYLGETLIPHREGDPRARLVDDRHASEAVYRIETASASAIDLAYFRVLVEHLVKTLDTTGAGILNLDEESRVLRTVAFWHGGGLVNDFTLELEHEPCREAIRRGFYRCEEPVTSPYTEYTQTAEGVMRQYMGIRLESPGADEPVGTLIVYEDREGKSGFDPAAETVLRVCAGRAGAELGRMRLIDSLQRSIETLEHRLSRTKEPG